MQKLVFSIILTFYATCIYSQKVYDKAEADKQVCERLLAVKHEPQNWHPEFIVKKEMLKETNERNIFRVMGDAFQVKSLRSDFYVKKEKGKWYPIYDSRYPVESLANLLLARIQNNSHQIELRHHQYGNHIASMTIPLQHLHNLFGPDMELYCRVAIANNNELEAWLVFYQKDEQFIHLLKIRTPTKPLFDQNSTLCGDFYANIPQGNIKSIFNSKDEKTKKNETDFYED